MDIRDLKRLRLLLDAVRDSIQRFGRVTDSERKKMLRLACEDCGRCLEFWTDGRVTGLERARLAVWGAYLSISDALRGPAKSQGALAQVDEAHKQVVLAAREMDFALRNEGALAGGA
ncbi:hypothetical protein JCM15519_04090 [Fundidesulfovibrio butyratiphilus]